MLTFPDTASVRDVQRNYRKLFDRVKVSKKPLILMRNNKPDVAIIDVGKLEELEALASIVASIRQIEKGEVKILKSLAELG